MNPVTQDEAEDTRIRLLARVQELATTIPALLNPEHQVHGPRRADAVSGPGVQRERMLQELALAAATLMRAALDDDPELETLTQEVTACVRRLGARKRLGHGWLDSRMVMRPQLQRDTDLKTGEVSYTLVRVSHGPYVYYRWSEGGKRRSLYLGRADNQEGWREKLAAIGVDLDDVLATRNQGEAAVVDEPAAVLEEQVTPPATNAEASLPVAMAPPSESPPSESLRGDAPPPRIPLSYGIVKVQKKALTTFVATLRHKASLGTRDGQQLLGMMQAMLTTFVAENRRRAILEELDRPHADADDLAVAIAEVRRLAAQDPRARTWQQVIDEGTTRLATGPIRRDADRYALFNAAEELAMATALAAISGDDLLPYLEAQDIDPTPWL